MELHSYAKTRSSSRKWTIEQKRKLVENRITLDVLFNIKAFKLQDSWIKLMKVSDLESFGIIFVRNQWINILTKYKGLVDMHTYEAGADISEETRDLITSEWEFFDKIYRFIKYKEKLNHGFRFHKLIKDEINDESLNIPQQSQLFSTGSSTDDDITIKKLSVVGQQLNIPNSNNIHNPNLLSEQNQNINMRNTITTTNIQNNIHSGCSSKSNDNSISKSRLSQHKHIINPTSNIQLSLQNSNNNKNDDNNTNLSFKKKQIINSSNLQNNLVYSSTSKELCSFKTRPPNLLQQTIDKTSPVSISGGNGSGSGLVDRKSKKLHKRKSNRFKNYKNYRKYYKKSSKKIDRKINSFCQIFAQIVEKDYPEINVANLLYSSAEDSTCSSD